MKYCATDSDDNTLGNVVRLSSKNPAFDLLSKMLEYVLPFRTFEIVQFVISLLFYDVYLYLLTLHLGCLMSSLKFDWNLFLRLHICEL